MTEPQQRGVFTEMKAVWIELGGKLCRMLVILAVIPALAGGYVLLSQVAMWLRSGIWVSLPLLYAFTDFWPIVGERYRPDQLERITEPGRFISAPLALISHVHLNLQFPAFASWLAEPGTGGSIQHITRRVFELLPLSGVLMALTVVLVLLLLLCSASATHRVRQLQREGETGASAESR
jgi:hypothetical protein